MTIPARLIGAILLLASLSGAAFAQQYPSGPITIVVPFTPGGTTDILGRLAGEVLQNEFKQGVIVENRTGGGGVIGNASVARAAPDGQTLLLAPTAFSIVPFTTKNLPYDAARDFKTITLMGYTANVMVVSPTLPVNTVKEFIEYAKSGDKYVLQDSATGTTYDIDHQDEVSKHVGRKVQVTGTLDPNGKMIHLQPSER